jgi:hypothetical protein
MTAKTVNEVLQMVIDRTAAEKAHRIATMRAELVDYGYSIVTTVWLNEVLREMPLAGREVSK